MTKNMDPVSAVVLRLRQSSYRRPLLKQLLRLDNWLRRWITFFSFENNTHPKHRLTNYHQFFLDNIAPKDTVLDAGSGLGLLACDLAGKASRVVGIDMNEEYIAQARQHCRRENITFILGDATTYDFNKKFDAVVLSNVLEHIKDRPALLRRLAALSPRILIRVPMIDRDWLVVLKKELGVEYRLDPTHYLEYTEPIFRQEVAAAGLTIEHLFVRFGELYAIVRNKHS
jgi:2-polyprenyl-3-methyl-5-hydroxy-6-metoxy-1,4-benzoquinol methylase